MTSTLNHNEKELISKLAYAAGGVQSNSEDNNVGAPPFSYSQPQVFPARDSSDDLGEIVSRIYQNMSAVVEESNMILKAPLPYDSCNLSKGALMLEVMNSGGSDAIWKDVWTHLEPAFSGNPQTTPYVLRTGVSGMGKTKAAYDIGRNGAFIIMNRIVERDSLTEPWEEWESIVRKMLCKHINLEKYDMKTIISIGKFATGVLLYLVIAHFEWALNISEVARQHPEFEKMIEDRMKTNSSSVKSVAGISKKIIHEVVLRCQRNGLAHRHVTKIFKKRSLEASNIVEKDFSPVHYTSVFDSAIALLYQTHNRARNIWEVEGKAPRIVFVFDEVQALEQLFPSTSNIFQIKSSVDSEFPHSKRSCFYGLLNIIQILSGKIGCCSLMLGTNFDLSSSFLNSNSPTQGVGVVLDSPFSLTPDDIKILYKSYLKESVWDALDDDKISKLRGRPLFASYFWTSLAGKISSESQDNGEEIVRKSLDEAYDRALKEAIQRINVFWDQHTPDSQTDQIPSKLIRYLFHSMMMSGKHVTIALSEEREELTECITRGILNCTPSSLNLDLNIEPITLHAITESGMKKLLLGTDGIMEYLSMKMREPIGGEVSDQGPAQESCVSWCLVRKSILFQEKYKQDISLLELLEDFQPIGDLEGLGTLSPELSSLKVSIKEGRTIVGFEDLSPLELLQENPDALIHVKFNFHGADVMFLARKSNNTEGNDDTTVPVLLQLKNRISGDINEAINSLCIPDWGLRNEIKKKQNAFLQKNPSWMNPIRVVLTARSYPEVVLFGAALLNKYVLKQPLLLLQTTKGSLGVNIFPKNLSPFSTPTFWPAFLTQKPECDPLFLTLPNPKKKIKITGPLESIERLLNFIQECDREASIQSLSLRNIISNKFTHSSGRIITFSRYSVMLKLFDEKPKYEEVKFEWVLPEGKQNKLNMLLGSKK